MTGKSNGPIPLTLYYEIFPGISEEDVIFPRVPVKSQPYSNY